MVVFEDLDSGIAALKITVNGPSHGEALLEKTGQTTCYDTNGNVISCTNTGHDGDIQAGVSWPNPRFTDNSDGTVTDNLTGLMWLKNANCIQTSYPGFDNDIPNGDGAVTWQHALDFVAGINSGAYSNCGGGYTDWRLPNVKELQSLINYGYISPALPNTAGTGQWTSNNPFTNVQMYYYWSGTTEAEHTFAVWEVDMYDGYVDYWDKSGSDNFVWPVRGGDSR
jgi:hypothetical protein